MNERMEGKQERETEKLGPNRVTKPEIRFTFGEKGEQLKLM
jgi:hypothetical protein